MKHSRSPGKRTRSEREAGTTAVKDAAERRRSIRGWRYDGSSAWHAAAVGTDSEHVHWAVLIRQENGNHGPTQTVTECQARCSVAFGGLPWFSNPRPANA